MISSVFLTGRLGPLLDESTRYVEIDSVLPGPSGTFETHHIPVRCNRGPSAHFLRAKEGGLITLQGRLQQDETFGLVVALELEDIYSASVTK